MATNKESRTKKTVHIEDGIFDFGWDALCGYGSHYGSIYGELRDGWAIERLAGGKQKKMKAS